MEFDDQEIKDQTLVLKGKRTKRPRPMYPFVLAKATTSSSCSSAEAGDGGLCDLNLSYGGGGGAGDCFTTSQSNSGEFTQRTADEEDMANCLILLAQGQSHQPQRSSNDSQAIPDVYECKTCNRRFPSFQALGGHRASHKKPKIALQEKKPPAENSLLEKFGNTSLSLQIGNNRDSCSPPSNKSRAHECSLCGAEFTSGQALGGHMRRHRPLPAAARASNCDDSQEVKKSRIGLLKLDLNLPAPEDEPRESKFPLAPKDQVLVFATSSLVDCHF